jgi:signal transduction histidine kinase
MPVDAHHHRARTVLASWTSSYWLVILLALAIGGFAVLSNFGFDWLMHRIIRPVYASDLLEGTVATIFSAAALLNIQARRRELQARMQIVEDVNHHVRNALSSVVLSAALREDPELDKLVRDACERIDWVLSDVLPQSIECKDVIFETSEWTSGRQLARSQSDFSSSTTKNMRN